VNFGVPTAKQLAGLQQQPHYQGVEMLLKAVPGESGSGK
jgi:hypothetical protein